MTSKYMEIIKDSWKRTILNPTLGLFFVLFLIVLNFFSSYLSTAKSAGALIIFYTCIFMTSIAFFSGWFHLAKTIIGNKQEDIVKNAFSTFIEGIGKNTISTLIATIIYIVTISLILIIVGQICFYIFGSPEEIFKEMFPILQDAKAFSDYLNKLSPDQRTMILGWQISVYISAILVHFVYAFYVPALFSKENTNIFLKPFIVFKDTFKYIFKNFFMALAIFVTIQFINLVFTILMGLSSINPFLSIIVLFGYIYFIIFAVMLVFNCYEQKNNSINRCDSIGENISIDTDSKED